MFHALHGLEPASRRTLTSAGSRRARRRLRSRSDRASITAWDDTFVAFDARIRMLHLWATGMRELASSPELDWCIACLADVRSALYQLHVSVLHENLAPPDGPPIVSYLSEAYVWCGDVLGDVEALVQRLRGAPFVRVAGVAEDSAAYIDEFLAPLFRRLCEDGRGTTADPPLPPAFLPLAERLHAAIVSLDWVLRSS